MIKEVLRGPFRDPLRGRFPSQRLSVLLPLIVLPLELSPNTYALEEVVARRGHVRRPRGGRFSYQWLQGGT